MSNKLLFRLFALVAAMMCALGASAIEAYACYTSSNTTLTFYYDNYRSSRTGTTYDLNTGSQYTDWDNDGTKAYVTKVVFHSSFANYRPTTTFDWFYGMQNLQSITGISNLNTSEVTNMSLMFQNCTQLTSLDLSHFNTSKVTDMGGMFSNSTSLTSLDLSSFNTSKVTNMGWMFNKCSNLRTIYVGSGWNTASVTASSNMFTNCTSLVGGQGTTYNASNPTDKTYAHIDGGTSNPGYFTAVTEAYACYTSSNMTLTFYYDNLRSTRTGTTYDLNTGTNVPDWVNDHNAIVFKVVFDLSFANARPTSTSGWFLDMQNLQTITDMNYLNTSEVTDMSDMFALCPKLTSLDLSSFNTSKVIGMTGMFNGSTGLTRLDLSSFNTSKVTYMTFMFQGCSNLRTIYVGSGWTTAAVTWYYDDMFTGCTSLVGGQGTTYDANYVDKTYAHIDGGPSNPGYFTAEGAEPWGNEAYACYTSSNTTLTFYYDKLRSTRTGTIYDLPTGTNSPTWDTDEIKANATQVVFDPSFANARPTSTHGWFYEMSKLQSITGMEYLNTSEVTDMSWMFGYCSGLTSLDLSSFNTAKVTDMPYMFYSCYYLETIYVSDGWSTTAVTYSYSMFDLCVSLVGGNGTTYDSDHVDATYAHIDGGTSNPGYFTEKGSEAYACYTSSNTTLTFYYDNQRSSRSGTTYDLNTGSSDPGWLVDPEEGTSPVTKVVFNSSFASARPTTTYSWFYGMENLQSITGMSYLNTSEVTNMGWMFGNCTELTNLDLSHFNTFKVTEMGAMFYCCSSLTSLDLSSFNTSKVTRMPTMFNRCTNLRTVYVGNGWSTVAVTYSANMFSDCTSLVGGQGTTYNASNPKDKTYAHIDGGTSNPGYFTEKGSEAYACYTSSNTTLTFYYDNYRSSRTGTTYDLNTDYSYVDWDTDGTNANVTKVVFDPSFADARPTTTYNWFYNMENLQSITGMSYLNTSEVTIMDWMFGNCTALTSLDLSHFNTSKVTDMWAMFYHSYNLRTVYVGNGWSTAAVTNSAIMFSDCTSLVGGQGTTYNASNPKDKTYAHIDGGPSNPGYFTAKNAGQRGDVNGDGSVNISDVTTLIDYLLSGNPSGVNVTAADCNQDSSVNISDVTSLIDYLLSGTW
jgi:surface protein